MRQDTDMADHPEQATPRSDDGNPTTPAPGPGGNPTTAPGRRGGGTRTTPPLTYVRFGERPLLRLPQLFIGLALYGFSMAVMVRAGLGLSPWSVLNEGLEKHTSLSFGTLTAVVGASVLLLWIPLRQRPAFGTAANIVVIAFSSDLGLALVPEGLGLPERVGLLLAGILANALSVAVYVGARFGPGPRDGLMTGAAALTGRSIRVVRTSIEIAVLAVGWLLGGGVGLGTVLYALAVGPMTQFFLPWFAYTSPTKATRPDPRVTGSRIAS
ncbi:YitT family protein [Streptomyces sp. NPDC048527]|uniref:membrane protein YczE n=1 Tax=Streptomyces sp. NPDC048527 TaxID=3365568 RepID=UPI00371AF719